MLEENKTLASMKHQLIGRNSNHAVKLESISLLHSFFTELSDEGEPHATKVVRTRARIALRDDDDIIELPSCYSKRSLYCRMMFSMGWVVKADNNGNFGKLGDYTERVFDEEWVEGVSAAASPFSFETFRKFWLVNYCKLRIRKPSYDTGRSRTTPVLEHETLL